MANECFRVRGEGQSKVLIFRSTCKPLLLFRHCTRVRGEKSKSVTSRRKYVVIRFSWLRFVDDLPRLIETLQSQEVVSEIFLQGHLIRRKTYALPRDLHGFFILRQSGEYYAQIVMCGDFPWVTGNRLLIGLGRLLQFPSDVGIIIRGDLQPFPLAG